MWNAVEVLVQVVMTSRCKCICAQHQHYRLGQDKCFAYRDSGREDYCEKRGSGKSWSKDIFRQMQNISLCHFFPLVMLKIIIFRLLTKLFLRLNSIFVILPPIDAASTNHLNDLLIIQLDCLGSLHISQLFFVFWFIDRPSLEKCCNAYKLVALVHERRDWERKK